MTTPHDTQIEKPLRLFKGIRYGKVFLVSATIFAVAAYLLVITSTSFWVNNPILSTGLLIGLIVLPIFIYTLLNNINKERKRAQQASLAKDRFIANMSHEMRTPLNGIIGMSDMLAKTTLNIEQRECANTIQASAQSLLDIAEDVLDISKIGTGKLKTNKVEFDLRNLVNSTVNLFAQQAQKKGLILIADIDAKTPCRLEGDAQHLRQVMINLVGNAIKFTNSGSINIQIRPEHIDTHTTRINIEISDTGIGISHDQQHNIFESFTQEDDSVTRRYGGLGLGTTISRALVRIMGGEISMDSTPGKGTTFSFTLPFNYFENSPESNSDEGQNNAYDRTTIPIEDEYKPNSDVQSNHLSESDSQERKAVLVISSNTTTQIMLGNILSNWDIDAHYASNATDAFSRLIEADRKGVRFDTLIVDQAGIDIDAIHFAHAVEGEDSIHAPTLILLYPGQHRHDALKFMNNGYCTTLASPVNKRLLFNALYDPTNNLESTIQEPAKIELPETCPLHILVAEDNRVSQRVIERILEQHGYQSTIIDNGTHALELLGSNKYDLVILDLHMPDMSGIDLVNTYNANHNDEALPFIILTANVTPEAERACHQAGVAAFLTKPVTSNILINTIESVFDSEKAFTNNNISTKKEDTAILDSEALIELVALDAGNGFLNRLCSSFEEDSESLLENIRVEIDNKNHDYIKELIHALKGSAGNVGASQFHQTCAHYCDMSENEFLDHQKNMLTDLHEKFSKARHALREYIEDYNSLAS